MLEYFTQSAMGQFFRCGEQFRRVWLEDERIPPGIAAKIGTGLHKGAEVNYRAKIISGRDEPLSVVQDAARDGYIRSLQSGVFFPIDEVSSAKKIMAEGVDVAVKLAKVYREELAPSVQPKLIEQTLYLEVPELPIPFKGTIDLLTAGDVWRDMKSSDKRWPAGRADSETQATLYWKLVKGYLGKPPSGLFYDIFTKSGFNYQPIETTRTEEDFTSLVQKAQLIWKSISAGIFYPAQPGAWICSPKWCGFWWSCQYIPEHRKTIPNRSLPNAA